MNAITQAPCRNRYCFMCGKRSEPAILRPTRWGMVCDPCAEVCVEVTMDKLAGAMAAQEDRDVT